jgi:anti-anti-sigma factor
MSSSPRVSTIGYITPQIHSNYLRMLLAGAYQAAEDHGKQLVIFQTTPHVVVANQLGADVIDGWIALFYRGRYDNTDSEKALATIAQAGKPLVTISQEVPGVPVVRADNTSGMHAMISHLIDLGHRRIAFLAISSNPDTPERFEGYRQALADQGIPYDPTLVFPMQNGEPESGALVAKQLLAAGLPCTAAAFCNDNTALGALRVLQDAGVRIPDDLAITGFDDVPDAQIVQPALTTVRMRFDAIGRAAVEQLLTILEGASMGARRINIPTLLVSRRSAGEKAESLSPVTRRDLGLAGKLAEIVSAPLTLAPGEAPEHLWPGAVTVAQTIEGVFDERRRPDEHTLQQAWNTAIQIAAYADPLENALALAEETLEAELAHHPANDPVHVRASQTMRLMRTTLLRACRVAHIHQIDRSERSLYSSNQVALALAVSDLGGAQSLNWLAHTDAIGGLLALRSGQASGVLQLVGRYPTPPEMGLAQIVARQFPPVDLLSQERRPLITVLPLQASQRDWGALVLALPKTWGISALDNTSLLAALLTARIDSAIAQRGLEEQQVVTRLAYERERALSQAVIELGCPVIPLGSAALLVPLIGVIDSQRAHQIITTVLKAIEVHRADQLLLDLTGVPLIDSQVAGTLVQVAQMARLLGTRAVLIGVRPEIAQSIVGLDIDLRELRSYSSLADALAILALGIKPYGTPIR